MAVAAVFFCSHCHRCRALSVLQKAISGTHFAVTFCRMMNDFNIVGAREFAGEAQGEGAKLAVRILDAKEDIGNRVESIVYSKADRILDGLEKSELFGRSYWSGTDAWPAGYYYWYDFFF